jgi:predicted SAM-dependent methyltransferase
VSLPHSSWGTRLLARNYDVMVRYLPAARRIRVQDPQRRWSVLDVGSGASGIAPFLPGWRPMSMDRFRQEGAESGARFCQASATQLPFRDRAWDVVTCIDVLEHLAPEDRTLAIQEALRVARRMVVIACPCGPRARAADDAMHRAYVQAGQPPPSWLQEHLRYPHPDADALEATVREEGARRGLEDCEVFFNESLALQRVHRFLARTTHVGYKLFSVVCTLVLPILTRPTSSRTGYRCFLVATPAPGRR